MHPMSPAPLPSEAETYDFAAEERDLIVRKLRDRIDMSVRRRAPFMSDAAQKDLAEDLTENLFDYLKGVFDL